MVFVYLYLENDGWISFGIMFKKRSKKKYKYTILVLQMYSRIQLHLNYKNTVTNMGEISVFFSCKDLEQTPIE